MVREELRSVPLVLDSQGERELGRYLAERTAVRSRRAKGRTVEIRAGRVIATKREPSAPRHARAKRTARRKSDMASTPKTVGRSAAEFRMGDERARRAAPSEDLEGQARKPKSRVRIAPRAWSMRLSRHKNKLDPLISAQFEKSDVYLCRYVVSVVEQGGEQVKWVEIEVGNPDTTIYKMWPTATYRTTATVEAEAGVKGELGVGNNLDFVDLSAGAKASVVWKTSWQWVTALVKAWGQGEDTAGWQFKRDKQRPFAGDRDCFVILELRKGQPLSGALASIRVRIKPRLISRSFTYEAQIAVKVTY